MSKKTTTKTLNKTQVIAIAIAATAAIAAAALSLSEILRDDLIGSRPDTQGYVQQGYVPSYDDDSNEPSRPFHRLFK